MTNVDLHVKKAADELDSWFIEEAMEGERDVGKLAIVQESDQHDDWWRW